MTPLTFGSLFAGIGGFDLGFERAGMQCKWQVEIDQHARQVLKKHWPRVWQWNDVRTFPPPACGGCGLVKVEQDRCLGCIADFYADWRVDVICGGFPCQDISLAGTGDGLAGDRSGLFFELMRVACVLRPRFLVLENVAALLVRGMDEVLWTLAACGFNAEWDCVQAAAFGAPHLRDRAFILAYSTEVRWQESANESRRNGQLAATRKGRMQQFAGETEWMPEPGVGRVVDGIPGKLDCDRLGALGNSIVPQVAEWIGRRIVEAVQ